MKHSLSILLCILLFAACLFGLDRLFVMVDAHVPVYMEVREFYLDFRRRFMEMATEKEGETVEKVIERGKLPSKKGIEAEPYSPGYVYADEKGELQFVERIEEIPMRFRKGAQPLKQ